MESSVSRQKAITRISFIGILTNILIALAKIVIGLAASSIAIITEGINNATDAGSSFLTLVGTKLSEKHPDENHPFGYGRVEYLTGLVVGIVILYPGITFFIESVQGILHPEEVSITPLAIIIVAVTAVIKFFLGNVTVKTGESTGSEALIGVGKECRNDSYFSIVTIVSSLIFLITGHSFDAWAGLVFSILIIKAGAETLWNTSHDIIGGKGEDELAKKIFKEIRGTDGIIGIADMMLHNYGPDRYSGSVNVEVDHNRTIGDIYEVLHELQLRIMHEHNVTMVFGIYAVDADSEKSKEMRKYIGKFIYDHEHVKSFHALYISEETKSIYVDFIVDYSQQSWEALEEEFTLYMAEKYPDYRLELTVETEFV